MSTRRKRQPPALRHHVDVPDDVRQGGGGQGVAQVPAVVPAAVVVTDWDRLVALVDQGDAVAALQLVPAIRHELEHLTRLAVQDMRGEGYSWHDVGQVLGVSRQAVTERFGNL